MDLIKNFLIKVVHWMLSRLSLIPNRDGKYTIWFLSSFLIASMVVAIITAIGNPTGVGFLSYLLNIGKAVAINGLLFFIWTFVVGALLSFLYVPLPRLFLGSFSYTIFASVFILINEDSGTVFSYIVGVSYSTLFTIFTLFLILLFNKKVSRMTKFVVCTAVIILPSIYLLNDGLESKLIMRELPAAAIHSDLSSIENPAENGRYSFSFLTYGSGNDKHREEFGKAVDITTPSVDASSFITRWDEKREKFWGFNSSNLPVNGRVWLPEGDGPFPVILMVHGNHTMEDFSTSGYDYLGELLASRGFVTVSVDEDFVNYSNSSGIPNNDYELRAWMLLKHLIQLDKFNQQSGHAFYQKLDLNQVGLVGHSRGGQAAPMAADYNRFFKDEFTESMKNIQIKAIVALAPTDKKLDGKRPKLENVSYLVIQGAQDGDINNFRGERQYYRTELNKDNNSFKSSLYIAGANHSQFNTEWGSMDTNIPKGLFLSRRQLMDANDQRQIAKVYISAFFESTLHGNTTYEKLFRDYQFGKEWLPNNVLVSKYQSASFSPIIQFSRDEPDFANGITMDEESFAEQEIISPKDRLDNNRPRGAVRLKWEEAASYSINLSNNYLSDDLSNVVFTMANIDKTSIPEIKIELATTDGISVQLPLKDFMPFPPVISSEFTTFGLLDDYFRDGKYENSWEPVFQTFEIPFHAFELKESTFDKSKIDRVTLHLSKKGAMLIESVGFSD